MADKRKVVAVVLVAILLVSGLSAAVIVAVNSNNKSSGMEKTDLVFESADGKKYDVYKSGYRMNTEGVNADVTFFYSDGYFSQDAKIFNKHLSSLSMAMSTASLGVNRNPQYVAVKEVFSKLGFEKCFTNPDYDKEPTADTSAAAFAIKKIKIGNDEKTIVGIVMRSSGYGAEWINNLQLGSGDGEAAGPMKTADKLFNELKAYLSDNGIDPKSGNTLFWFNGYSRGAALANLVSKRTIDAFDNNGSRTYCYLFGSPMFGTEKCKIAGNNYDGIFTIVNDYDVINRLPFKYAGFLHYGTEKLVSDFAGDRTIVERRNRFTTSFGSAVPDFDVPITELKVDGQGLIPVSLSPTGKNMDIFEFEDRLIYILEKYCKLTRETWAKNIDHAIPILFENIGKITTEDLLKVGMDIVGLLQPLYRDARNIHESELDSYIDNLLSNFDFADLMRMTGLQKDDCKFFVSLILKFAYGDYFTSGIDGFGIIGTLIKSYKEIIVFHYPVNCMSWVFAIDDYYKI